MNAFWNYFLLSAPLFVIVFVGYAISMHRRWRREWTSAASKFIFAIALPALLFSMMTKLHELPPVDSRLLLAFFGGCFIVFVIGRFIAARVFHLEPVAQSVFGLGGVFSNNALLGIPLAKMTLGDAALPSVGLVLVFNAFTLWTLVSVAVEWSQHGSFDWRGIARTAVKVTTNPLVAAILLGSAIGLAGIPLPHAMDLVLTNVGHIAAPAALLVLGMSLADYGIRHELNQSLALVSIKLVLQPIVVWLLALALGLPPMERNVVVLLASLAIGANVYLMSVQFQVLQGVIPSALVLSTLLAALTTPTFLALLRAFG